MMSGRRLLRRFTSRNDNRLVGVRGFEPPAPASRTQCSTRLSYTPAEAAHIASHVPCGKPPLQPGSLAQLRAMQVFQTLQHRGDTVHHLEQLSGRRRGEVRVDRCLDRSDKPPC